MLTMHLQARPLPRARDGELQVYNRLVLQYQDEAFSLAFDLLGEESAAAALVQQVFLRGFSRRDDERLPFRLRVLRWLVGACLQRRQPLTGLARLDPRLACLSNEEVIALALVERLGLSYAEAGDVMGTSAADFRGLIATARYSYMI